MNKNELGLACWGMRELTLEKQIQLCKRLQVRLMEIDIANAPRGLPLNCGEQQIEATKRLFAESEMPLYFAATGNDFTLPEEMEVQKQIEKVKKVTDLCGRLGIRYLRFFAGFSPVEQITSARFEVLMRSIESVCQYAQKRHVQMVMELHGGVCAQGAGVKHFHSVSTQWDTVKEILKGAPQSMLFLLDPANLCAVGEDPCRYYQLLAGRIAYLHAKEFQKISGGGLRPAACGVGAFDWAHFFCEIQGFEGPVLIEYEEPQDVEQGMERSLNFMKDLIEK
ncbi:MAG: hypothetical protein DBX91_09065 [Subdoligranulum variabile]|nr:MAG: hypothetical protein DBX91_09065 [Subdoligranulum variabile]